MGEPYYPWKRITAKVVFEGVDALAPSPSSASRAMERKQAMAKPHAFPDRRRSTF